jgi:hypothetical protein
MAWNEMALDRAYGTVLTSIELRILLDIVFDPSIHPPIPFLNYNYHITSHHITSHNIIQYYPHDASTMGSPRGSVPQNPCRLDGGDATRVHLELFRLGRHGRLVFARDQGLFHDAVSE